MNLKSSSKKDGLMSRNTGAINRACQYKVFRKTRTSYSSGEHLNLLQNNDLKDKLAMAAS